MSHASNKGERNKVKFRKFLRRLKIRGLKKEDDQSGKHFRTTGTPCSCWMCDPHKSGEEKHSVEKRKGSSDDQE